MIFIAPYFNFAIFDSQCKSGGCSSQICSANPLRYDAVTSCEWLPEYGCNNDCKVRNVRCSFDQEFRQDCINCISYCKDQFDSRIKNISIYLKYENCTKSCYKN